MTALHQNNKTITKESHDTTHSRADLSHGSLSGRGHIHEQLRSTRSDQPGTRTEAIQVALYNIRAGDTVSEIAKRFKISQSDIQAVNPGLHPDRLQVGQSLKLPNVNKGFHIVTAGQSPGAIAQAYGIPVADIMRANPGLDPKKMQIGQAVALPARDNPRVSPSQSTSQHAAITSAITSETGKQHVMASPSLSASFSKPPPTMQNSTPISITSTQAPPSFFASMVKCLGYEGGITRDKNDAAHKHGVAVTNLGVTGAAMKDHILKTENRVASNAEVTKRIECLTTDEALKVYASGFWHREYQAIGSKMAFLLFDWGINSHPTTATRHLQRALGVPATGKVDRETISRIHNMGEDKACSLFTECRKDFYRGLARERPSDQRYLGGWLQRADSALEYVHSARFAELKDVFQRTEPRGCDLLDPVREGVISLKKGSKEPAMVRVLQERLTSAGWSMAVDGKFGSEMERVVADFKGRFNLPPGNHWGPHETKVLDAILKSRKPQRALASVER